MDGNETPRTDQPTPSAPRTRTPWARWVGAALVIVAIVAVVGLLGASGGQSTVLAANVQDILEDPDEYLDQQVVVSGRVNEVLTHPALTLGSDLSGGLLLALVEPSAMVNGYDLVATVPMPQGALYQERDLVQFLGTVKTFDRESIADQFDIVLNEELFGDMEGDPVLLVERLDVTAYGGFYPSPVPLEESSPGATEPPASDSSD